MSKFKLNMETQGTSAKIAISGIIDEDFNALEYSLENFKQIEINLGQVISINSCGIREWIRWLQKANSAEILFHECPKIIVDQINMVQGFLPINGKVMSFYVPYFSDSTDSERSILFQYGNEFTEGHLNLPENVQDDEGNPMEIDVVEAKYFRFIVKTN